MDNITAFLQDSLGIISGNTKEDYLLNHNPYCTGGTEILNIKGGLALF